MFSVQAADYAILGSHDELYFEEAKGIFGNVRKRLHSLQ